MSTEQVAPQSEGIKVSRDSRANGKAHVEQQADHLHPTLAQVFAGNLAFATKDQDLQDLFAKFGTVYVTSRSFGVPMAGGAWLILPLASLSPFAPAVLTPRSSTVARALLGKHPLSSRLTLAGAWSLARDSYVGAAADLVAPARRYGFVTFGDQAEAEKAVAALDKTEVGGRPINVELAKPQSSTPRPPREKKVRAPVEANGDAEAVVGEDGEAKPKKKKARVSAPHAKQNALCVSAR